MQGPRVPFDCRSPDFRLEFFGFWLVCDEVRTISFFPFLVLRVLCVLWVRHILQEYFTTTFLNGYFPLTAVNFGWLKAGMGARLMSAFGYKQTLVGSNYPFALGPS
jgi:hypothetical protein